MLAAWGIVVVALSLLCWAGQLLSMVAPKAAARASLMEAEADVDPTYWADIRGEARWDALTLWVMVVAGILLMADAGAWPYFALVGGGMYLYFGGRGIATRMIMVRERIAIGAPASVRIGILFLAIWAAMAAVTIVLAIVELEGRT